MSRVCYVSPEDVLHSGGRLREKDLLRKKHLCWVFENKDEFAGKVGECNVGDKTRECKGTEVWESMARWTRGLRQWMGVCIMRWEKRLWGRQRQVIQRLVYVQLKGHSWVNRKEPMRCIMQGEHKVKFYKVTLMDMWRLIGVERPKAGRSLRGCCHSPEEKCWGLDGVYS